MFEFRDIKMLFFRIITTLALSLISDWRFPYKRSYHPVCLYGEREVKTVVLRHCEEGAEPGTEVHRFVSAVSCRCHVCKSSEASCQALGGHIAGSDSWKQAKIVEMQQIP